MLVAITECDSLCRQMHSICLQLLNKPIAYVHTGIPSYPSVKSPLLLPFLLPLPIPTSFPPPRCPLPIFPPFPIAFLSISSPCPPLHCQPLPIPIAPLPISPSPLPPSRFPLPVSTPPPSRLPSTPPHPPFFLSTLPPNTSHSHPRFWPLPAPQHFFHYCPSPHRQL